MLRRVATGATDESVRLYVPDQALLFSSLDARRPGYARAVALARQAGFEPVLRLAGGHAAAFLESSMAFAWASADHDAHIHIQPRFEKLTRWIVEALNALGLDARIGEVPGEYCPGEFSVNIAGRVKVMGVGQRVIRGGAHVGGVLTIGQTDRLREVLIPVYEALGLEFQPTTAGGIADFEPALTPEIVIEAVLGRIRADGYAIDESAFSSATIAAAEALTPLHSPHRSPDASKALRPSALLARGKVIIHSASAGPSTSDHEEDESAS